MIDDFKTNERIGKEFVERMPGGAFVCRADGDMELLCANQHLVELFECASYEEFAKQVGNCYAGMVGPAQFKSISKELNLLVKNNKQTQGRLFYHIMTKKGNVLLAEEHWSLVQDPTDGPIYYSFLISREFETAGADYDSITGLYGKTRFQNYCNSMNMSLGGSNTKYAIVYLNLVNFKLLNVNRGIAEGDSCLKAVAEALGHVFNDAFLARLSDDHFGILDQYDGIEDRLKEFGEYFQTKNEDRYGVVIKWGYYSFEPNDKFDVEKALSYAKIACDHIKYVSGINGTAYTAKLAKQRNTAEHLVRSFDEALEKGWIEVYYQPVIRTITEQLCGMESLVRWNDPEFGFIMPNDFIGVLEECRQIHKLDAFVVEKVCQRHYERLKQGLPIVPVSVNFSRLDFVLCDMLQVVEDIVRRYDIPRDYIHIEITESMIASDEELMRSVIDGFRGAGYEIWMDDFGSGYSSLTVLKDYQFDMLKLDMKFLSNFTDKSRDIMRSAIIMAKDLGIKTLAEGVENKEQLEYLKKIGCDQIQGYYYGRPEPVGVIDKTIRERNITVETRKWRHFYDVASFHVKATDVPLEVIEDDGKNIKTLFMNDAYREQIDIGLDSSLEEIDRRIYHTASPLLEKYRIFAEQMKMSGKPEVFYYTNNDTYLCFRGQAIVQANGHAIIKASIYNVKTDANVSDQERLDAKLRVLNLLFKVILWADLKNQTLTPLLGTSPNMRAQRMIHEKVTDNNAVFAENNIFPTERQRYREFMDFSTAKARIDHAPFGYITDVFRIKQGDGNYRYAEVTLMMIPGTGGTEYLYCVKPYFVMNNGRAEGVDGLLMGRPASEQITSPDDILPGILWENMIWNSSVKFYWKNLQGRYQGASQAFLDYFGIQKLEDLVGKTAEEMGWIIDESSFATEDAAVLRRGLHIKGNARQCIANGAVRNVIVSKMPIYKDGKIIGLCGYFFDRDKELSQVSEELEKAKKDPITGLLNAHAFADSMIDYAIQYHDRNRNYGIIVIRNARHQRIIDTYGTEISQVALKEMGKIISEVMGRRSVIARAKESIFCVLAFVNDEKDLLEKAEKIEKKLNGLNQVKGNPITVRIRMSVKIRSWLGITDENIYAGALNEVQKEETE